MQFDAIYWSINDLGDSVEGNALKLLFDSETPDFKVMEQLLQSDLTPAQCIAIDRYCIAESATRMSFVNDLEPILNLVSKRVLEQLEKEPYINNISQEGIRVGANHASAFHALNVIGLNCGSKLLLKALLKNTDPEVIAKGVSSAAFVVLRGEINPDHELIELLKKIARSQESDYALRCDAIMGLCVVATDEFDSFIVEMTNDSDFRVASTAARLLGEKNLGKYRPLLEKLANSWSGKYDFYEIDELIDILNQ